MKKELLIAHLRDIKALSLEIENSSKKNVFGGDLLTHLDTFREKLMFFDHGEKDAFFMPNFVVEKKIESLRNTFSDKEFKTKYLIVQKRLLSIVNRYLKEMNNGLQELDLE